MQSAMKSILYAVIVFFATIPMCLTAQTKVQLVDKRPESSVRVTRYAETPYALNQYRRAADPAIAAMVSAINADTLRATLQELQDWGSRFLMNDNKKEIAMTLVKKFQSYGYTDVKLDSFYLVIRNWSGYSDSSWQYNVVCTFPGSSAPEEVYVVGGHWDSICLPDPVNDAPGVDDNGTAVAATLEIARIMKQFNYHPEATIRFTLFAAEELGLFGSRDAAAKARNAGTDVRYMLNLDMISNNPDNIAEVKVYQYYGFEWAGFVAADAVERYTDLSAVIPQNFANSGSDSYPYWLEGFPSAYFEEIAFSPNWHKPTDKLSNCNVPYLKKVTGGALATLAEQLILPYPQNLVANSSRDEITLKWKSTANDFVKGVNVYRSASSGNSYQKITTTPVTGSVYHDKPAELNKPYYYVITTMNDSLRESAFSNEVTGARFNFCDTLLVLANVKGNQNTPDSVRAFYEAVLDTIPHKWIDVNAVKMVSLTEFSRYRSILWMSNTLSFEPMTEEMAYGVLAFIENGGNMLYAGLTPGRFWTGANITTPMMIPEDALFHMVFKADSVEKKMQSMLFRANAVAAGYDTLNIDPLKFMDKNYPGQIFNVEVFAPAPEATVIYRFDSRYDSTTSLGKMKHRPVGLEYMGNDHKSILLSFPLYYLDTSDARKFMHFVVTGKFGYPVGVQQITHPECFALHVFPNPVKDVCNITFTVDQPGRVRLSLLSMSGKSIATWLDRKLEAGAQSFRFPIAALSPGFYELVLQHGGKSEVKKVIRIE
jgi:hypothetical protein